MGSADETSQGVSTNQSSMIGWDSISWEPTIRGVVKLQQKIFRDARAGNFSRMRKLQKLLVRSKDARLWAVKVVTEKTFTGMLGITGGSEATTFILRFKVMKDMVTCDVHLELERHAGKLASGVPPSRGVKYPL